MTMESGQIAELAEVELENFGATAPNGESMGSQRAGERSPETMIESQRDGHLSAELYPLTPQLSYLLSADQGTSLIMVRRTPGSLCAAAKLSQPGSERPREGRNRQPQSGE